MDLSPVAGRKSTKSTRRPKAVRARGLDLADIGRDDFPLPTLGPVLDRLRGEVLDGRGFVMLRGMPVEDRPFAESAAAYWGVGAYFGSARSQNAQGHLLGHVYDLGERPARPTRNSAATRPPSARTSISIAAMSSRCCACGARSPAGFDDRQLDGRAQCDGDTPARSAGAAVSAIPRRPPRRGAGGQGAVLRSAGLQRICRPSFGAVLAPAYRLVAAVSRGAAADRPRISRRSTCSANWRAIPNCGST